MRYIIWNREVGIVEACNLCKSVTKFKELKDMAKMSASCELPVYIGGKILTFVK